MPLKFNIHTDGGSRGNPGPAAVGVVVQDEAGQVIHQFGLTIGVTTNNVAEYQAVIQALEWANQQAVKPDQINFWLDSALVVHQLQGHWKIKENHLLSLAARVHQLEDKLGIAPIYTAIPREKNAAADAMVNQALDKC